MIETINVSAYKTDDINMLPYQLIRRIDRKWQELKAEGICVDKQFVRDVFDEVAEYLACHADGDENELEQLVILALNRPVLTEHYNAILKHYLDKGEDLTERDRDLNT